MSDSTTLILAIIGAVCGITGAVLGVINTWHQLQRNRLRLKVIPQHAIPVGTVQDAQVNFGIDVVNLSEFPVVIADVGFLLQDGKRATVGPAFGLEPKGRLPIRLEPRTQYSKCFWLDNDVLDLASVKSAYARTECGNTVLGMSPALSDLIRRSTAKPQ